MAFGLYIHTPFCRSKCVYCDFNSYVGRDDLIEPYVAALLGQISAGARSSPWARGPLPSITTIYFGGGNPAVLGGEALSEILTRVRRAHDLCPDAEISLEINPEDAGIEFLSFLRARGINRLSLGWQSLNDRRLALLGRRHDARAAERSLGAARAAGFENINVDLIFGLPGQTVDGWRQELVQAVDLAPPHISTYALTLEPGTPLAEQVAAGKMPVPDEDQVADMYALARRLLAERGYDHYEISNFARPGYRCRHNLNYWAGGDYLGVGAGAHSHRKGDRWWNLAEPGAFIEGLKAGGAVAGHESLDSLTQLRERVILGLRLLEGIDCLMLEREFGVDFKLVFAAAVAQSKHMGLFTDGRRLALTEDGLLLANEIMSAFV